MKQLLAVLLAVVAALSIYAVTAPAGSQGVSPRRVVALEKQVKSLRRDLNVLATVTARCLLVRAAGVMQFGAGETEGYEYVQANGDQALTTALDLVDPRDGRVELWLLQTTKECADALNTKPAGAAAVGEIARVIVADP